MTYMGIVYSLPETTTLARPETLAQYLDHLSPDDQEALRCASGGSLAPWQSLAEETYAPLYFDDLFSLAQDLERRGAGELAARTYQSIVQHSDETGSINRRARLRLEVLAGHGPLGEQIETSFSQLAEQVTSPELLLGMGAGSLAYGLTRFGSTVLFRSAGLGGASLRWGSRAIGVAAEAGAFVSVSRGVQILRGDRPFHQWHNQWGNEWVHTLGMLLTLRTVGWGVRSLYGPGYIPQSSFDFGLARLGEKAAMGLGLFTYHYGEAMLASEQPSLPNLAAQTLAETLVFVGAGQLSKSLWGPRLRALETRMEQGARRWEIPRPLQVFSASSAWQPAGVPPQLGLGLVFMTGNGEPPGGRRPTGTPPRRIVTPQTGRRPDHPREFLNELNLLTYLRGAQVSLGRHLKTDHAYWTMREAGKLTGQQVVDLLNALPNMSEIPRGRLVHIAFESPSPGMEFQKLGKSFLYISRPVPTPAKRVPRTIEMQRQDLQEVARRMDAISRRDSSPSIPTVDPSKVPTDRPGGRRRITLVPGASQPPPSLQGIRFAYSQMDFQEILNRSKEFLRQTETLEIFSAIPARMREADLRVLSNYVMAFPEGTVLRVHEEAARKTYHFQRGPDRVNGTSKTWLPPLNTLQISTDSLLGLFQGLSYFRDRPLRETASLEVKWQGAWDPAPYEVRVRDHFNQWDRFRFLQANFEFSASSQAQGAPSPTRILQRGPSGLFSWRNP